MYGIVLFLRLWFTRPLCDLSVIRERQDVVEYLSSTRNNEVISALQDSIKNIKDVKVSRIGIGQKLDFRPF